METYTIKDRAGNEFFRGNEKEVINFWLQYISGNVSSFDRFIGDTKEDQEDSIYEIHGNSLECIAKRSWN